MQEDSVVRFKVVQLERQNPDEANPEVESTAIAVYNISGSMDCCRVGFLRRHLLKYKDEYDGRLAQVRDIFSEDTESPSDRAKHYQNKGCCRATLIEVKYRESTSPPSKRHRP